MNQSSFTEALKYPPKPKGKKYKLQIALGKFN